MTPYLWLCVLGVMIDPVYPAGWFAVESPQPFLVGEPHSVIDPLWYDAERGVWRLTGTTYARVPVFLAPGQPACVWFAGDLDRPRVCLPQGWKRTDADRNGAVTSRDIAEFLSAWVVSATSGGADPRGDFNADLHANTADISAFLSLWLEEAE